MADIKRFILKPTIEAINGILHMENCKVEGIDGVPSLNKLTLNSGHFDLEFDATYRAVHPSVMIENLPELYIETPQAQYKIPEYNAHFEGTIMMGGDEDQHFDLRFSKLTQKNLNVTKQYFWRFIYPVDSNEWFLKVQAYPYTDDFGSSHFFNLICPDLDGHQMNLFAVKVEGQNWMVIDSTESISYEEMDHRVMALTTSLGFVLGKRYGDYCFHIASEEPTFTDITGTEALALQETRYCPFKILQTDNNLVEIWLSQHDYQQYALEELKNQLDGNVRWYYNDDATVTMDAFSKLSQLCYKTNDMLLATSMLIDGSMMNIEYQKPFFHVVLETITSCLQTNDEDKPQPPMPQEQYKEVVVPALIETLERIEGLSEEALRIFKSKIEHNLNTAPNRNKLEACFPALGYTLTKEDSDAIDKRNRTFHGHLTSEKQPLRVQQNDLFAMSLRLHKLCSILLLKAAGFEGKVINNEVLFGMKPACERRESVYIVI